MQKNLNTSENTPNTHDAIYDLTSPDNSLNLRVGISKGQLWYSLLKDHQTIIAPSFLSLEAADSKTDLTLKQPIKSDTLTHDETWEQPWGEQRWIRNHYNELALSSQGLTLRFRLFNDGLGFRHEISGTGSLTIKQESHQFKLPNKSKIWSIPAGEKNRYEYIYYHSLLSDIPNSHTPLTIELPNGKYASIHEAALYDYGAMCLKPDETGGLISNIIPLNDGNIAHVELPFNTPWRTVIVTNRAIDLTTSRLMLNLNEPSKIENTSWIKPTKFMGIWWSLHLGHNTWGSGPNHGATTENAIRYIDYCHQYKIPALLIEGWNEGWDGNWVENGHVMNFTKPYDDFNIHKVVDYARQKGVEIVGHHETAADIKNYESQLPAAYGYYKDLGIKYIKTGYVGSRINDGEFHHSQIGVRHYQKTVEMAAEHGIMLNIHEPIKGTGIERTWPNLMTREGAIGQEYEGGRIAPEHTTVLPFTRMLAGGMDYTPGLVNLTNENRKISTTLAKQLALYLTIYSSLHMAADLAENYQDQPALGFIQQVPTDWEITVPIDGVIGDYFVVARKDRHSNDWYLGAVTDENPRELEINLSFFDSENDYKATIYQDGADASWDTNPESMEISDQIISQDQALHIRLAPGGGCAIRFTPA